MKSRFLWVGIVFLVVIIMAAIFVWSWDWGSLKGYAEKAAGAKIGRKVTIDGEFRVDFSLQPFIHAEEVKVENVTWSSQPIMMHFPVLEVRIDLFRAVLGNLKILSLYLKEPEAVLQINEEGVENWSGKKAGEHKPADAGIKRLSTVRELRITDGKLIYENKSGKRKNTLKFTSCTASVDKPGGPLIARGEGERNDLPLKFQLQGAPLQELQGGDGRYHVKADVTIGEVSGTIDGTIVPAEGLERLDFQASSQGPDPHLLGIILGVPLPNMPPYDAKGHVLRQGPIWSIENLQGTIGESDISGSIRADTGGQEQTVKADLRSATAYLSDLEVFLGAEPSPARKKADKGPHVLPDKRIGFVVAPEFHSFIKYRADKVQSTTYPVDWIEASVEIAKERIIFHPLELGVAGGKISSEMTIDARKEPPYIRVKAEVRRVNLQRLLAKKKLSEGLGVLGGQIELHGPGNSVSRFLGSADGQVSIIMSGGELNKLLLNLMTLDVIKLLVSLSEQDKETVKIRCAVVDAPVEKGVAKIRSFVVDTKDTQLTVDGTLDLKNEKLDATIRPHPKNPRWFSLRSSINVSGTLRSPEFSPDKKELALKGLKAFAWGVFAAPLAALVPFIGLDTDEGMNCQELIDASKKRQAAEPDDKKRPKSK